MKRRVRLRSWQERTRLARTFFLGKDRQRHKGIGFLAVEDKKSFIKTGVPSGKNPTEFYWVLSEVFGEHILSRSSILPRTSTNERSMKLVVQFLSNRREACKETSTSPKCQLYLFSIFRKIICTKKDFPRWVPQALINDQKEKRRGRIVTLLQYRFDAVEET